MSVVPNNKMIIYLAGKMANSFLTDPYGMTPFEVEHVIEYVKAVYGPEKAEKLQGFIFQKGDRMFAVEHTYHEWL